MTTPRTARADSAHQTAQADALREAIRSNRVAAAFRAVPRGSTRPAAVTSTVDGRDHLVSAPASVGVVAGHGRSVALCGRLVVAAALTVPPGPTCLECETALHRVTTGGTTSDRRRGLMARLLWRRSSRGAGVMRWCVASFADGDTHLAEPGAPGQTVTAHCDGRQFRPLAILPGAPPDQEQVCPACQAGQPSPATQTRRTIPERVIS